ncbi:MAG: HIT family protein [Bacteroidota bacterium]
MSSIFSKIIAGEIPCYKVAENDKFLAFLDVRPLVAGHTLVIPKSETDYLFDMDDASYSELMLFAKYLALGLKTAVPGKKVGVSVIGLEVPHAHIHLVPLQHLADINFEKQRVQLSHDEYVAIAERISTALHTV